MLLWGSYPSTNLWKQHAMVSAKWAPGQWIRSRYGTNCCSGDSYCPWNQDSIRLNVAMPCLIKTEATGHQSRNTSIVPWNSSRHCTRHNCFQLPTWGQKRRYLLVMHHFPLQYFEGFVCGPASAIPCLHLKSQLWFNELLLNLNSGSMNCSVLWIRRLRE